MRIDFATLAFGYTVRSGGGTPNWATALGQGKGYKINDNPEIDNLLKGMVYSSVSLDKISSKIGKGGRVVSGNSIDSPILLASVFNRVFVNDTLIENGSYILIVTRDTSESHAGRLRFKYGPSNTYSNLGHTYSNEQFWNNAKRQLSLNEEACFFVYDISVRNQDELILRTIIVDRDSSKDYENSVDHHNHWDKLINDDAVQYQTDSIVETPEETQIESQFVSDFSPEWFEEKSLEFQTLDQEAQVFISDFLARFSVEKISELEGKDLLDRIFLNQNNKTNLCYVLEFDSTCRSIFGSIKSGTSYKYGLHYSKKNSSWATGTSTNPVLISEEKAIELGTQIRDYLVAGAELISETSNLVTENDYLQLYNDLDDITDGYINRVWFLKYYALLFPNLFPPIYSHNAQINVLKKLKIETLNNAVCRLAGMADFARKCNISNIMFGKIFWTYCNDDEIKAEDGSSEGEEMKTCLDIERPIRSSKTHPLNTIIYGAPGTGKTYSTAEYALAIIENRDVDLSYKTPEQRKKIMQSYNDYVKSGQIVFTTFHQSYGYEEFIQGLRPDVNSEEMKFKKEDGVFKKIADEALFEKDPSKNYVIIIDEINRANISKVFGELITLIEEDKRWGEVNQTCVTLQSGDPFAVPNNLYIVGTMNSADKSISLIDAALRRRFEFVEQKPMSELISDSSLRDVFTKLNESLEEELQSSDLLIGHSYFMGKSLNDLDKIMNNSIIPLLYEYFYDNKKKVLSTLNNALKDTTYKAEDVKLGRVFVKKAE